MVCPLASRPRLAGQWVPMGPRPFASVSGCLSQLQMLLVAARRCGAVAAYSGPLGVQLPLATEWRASTADVHTYVSEGICENCSENV